MPTDVSGRRPSLRSSHGDPRPCNRWLKLLGVPTSLGSAPRGLEHWDSWPAALDVRVDSIPHGPLIPHPLALSDSESESEG